MSVDELTRQLAAVDELIAIHERWAQRFRVYSCELLSLRDTALLALIDDHESLADGAMLQGTFA